MKIVILSDTVDSGRCLDIIYFEWNKWNKYGKHPLG
jgi:hypothetical protein